MELQLIRRVHPFHSLLILPQGQQASRGQIVHIPHDIEASFHTLLPLPPGEASLTVIAQKPGNNSNTSPYNVDLQRIYNALEWLIRNNTQYETVRLRETTEEEYTRYLESIQQSQQVEPQNVNPEMPPTQNHQLMQESAFIETLPKERILPPDRAPPVSLFDPDVELGAYPNLYPTGTGAMNQTRPVPLSTVEYIQLRLLHKDRRFQSDSSWPFRALVILNRHFMQRQLSWMLNNSRLPANSDTSNGPITASQIISAIENSGAESANIDVVKEGYKIIGRNIRGNL